MSDITTPETPPAPPAETPAEAAAPSSPAEGAPSETAVKTPVETPAIAGGASQAIDLPAEAPEEVSRGFASVAPTLVALEKVGVDDTYRVRPAEELDDVSALAMDIARLGQLYPVDVRLKSADGEEHFQIVTGFRRVAALRFLQREKVLARVHTDLSDEDATLLALASAIHGQVVDAEALKNARAWLEEAGRLTPTARDMLDKALTEGDDLAPESVEDEEVDADELAADVTVRLGEINQDLSLLADVFGDLDDERKQTLLTQLRYSAQLVEFLEGKS
jgi:uncharacterized ParB-like nuclease family protein